MDRSASDLPTCPPGSTTGRHCQCCVPHETTRDRPDVGLDTLLDLDGSILEQEGGYWIKIEVRRIPPSEHAHHGIRYSLTLHDRYGTRVLGYDNAHAVKPPKKFKFAGRRLPYNHRDRTASDKGVPYAFESAHRLLEDFFAEVDRVIKEARQ